MEIMNYDDTVQRIHKTIKFQFFECFIFIDGRSFQIIGSITVKVIKFLVNDTFCYQ